MRHRRRSRASSFGTVISKGTPSHPLFAIRWWEAGNRKQEGGFKTRTEATEALARVRAGLGDGTLVAKRAAGVLFDVAAQEWLELHSKPNLRSHADNAERYEKHVKPILGATPLIAVTPARILQLRAKLQEKKRTIGTARTLEKGTSPVVRPALSAGTINRVMSLVRAILKFAVVNGHIPAAPTDKIGRGRLLLTQPKVKMEPPIKSADDVGRLLAAVRDVGIEKHRPWLFAFFCLLCYTGLRRGEACGLRWPDVDLKRRLITVRRSYDQWTKSGRERVVPLPKSLVPVLEEHKLADEWKCDLVFPNDYGEMLSEDSNLGDWLAMACDRCGLPRVRVHDLRHVFGSFFVMQSGDIFTLQKILGHSTPQITSDTYAHLSTGYLEGVSDGVVYPTPGTGSKVLRLRPKKNRA